MPKHQMLFKHLNKGRKHFQFLLHHRFSQSIYAECKKQRNTNILRTISTGENKQYSLFGIIAYANMHFIAQVKKNDEWIMFNDSRVYKCPLQWIHFPEGGDDNNDLWNKTGRKLVVRLLFYKTSQ